MSKPWRFDETVMPDDTTALEYRVWFQGTQAADDDDFTNADKGKAFVKKQFEKQKDNEPNMAKWVVKNCIIYAIAV